PAVERVPPLRVAADTDRAGACQQRMRLEHELVSLLRLFADREQPDLRFRNAKKLGAQNRAHMRELKEVLGASVGVRPRVDEDVRPLASRKDDGNRGSLHATPPADVQE